MRERPEVVAALAAAGHELGNHLWSHGDPERQSRAELRAEIDRAAAAIGAAAGSTPRLVRPPYCGAPHAVARAAQGAPDALRRPAVASTRPTGAATPPRRSPSACWRRPGPGDIVCLHDGVAPNNSGTDTRAATAEAVALLVPALLERDLRPVTVSELLA